MVKIVWTKAAANDLKMIHDYIARDSKLYADRVVDKIISRTDRLEQFPKLGRVVPEFEVETIRELIEGSYRIIYQVNTDHIGIVRIHHSAKQLKERP